MTDSDFSVELFLEDIKKYKLDCLTSLHSLGCPCEDVWSLFTESDREFLMKFETKYKNALKILDRYPDDKDLQKHCEDARKASINAYRGFFQEVKYELQTNHLFMNNIKKYYDMFYRGYTSEIKVVTAPRFTKGFDFVENSIKTTIGKYGKDRNRKSQDYSRDESLLWVNLAFHYYDGENPDKTDKSWYLVDNINDESSVLLTVISFFNQKPEPIFINYNLYDEFSKYNEIHEQFTGKKQEDLILYKKPGTTDILIEKVLNSLK